jgi:hypothetical protein
MNSSSSVSNYATLIPMCLAFFRFLLHCKKGKLVPVHTIMVYTGSRGIVPLIHNIGT